MIALNLRMLRAHPPRGVRAWLNAMTTRELDIVAYSPLGHLLLIDVAAGELGWFFPTRRVIRSLGAAENVDEAVSMVRRSELSLLAPLSPFDLVRLEKRCGILRSNEIYGSVQFGADPRSLSTYRRVELWEYLARVARHHQATDARRLAAHPDRRFEAGYATADFPHSTSLPSGEVVSPA